MPIKVTVNCISEEKRDFAQALARAVRLLPEHGWRAEVRRSRAGREYRFSRVPGPGTGAVRPGTGYDPREDPAEIKRIKALADKGFEPRTIEQYLDKTKPGWRNNIGTGKPNIADFTGGLKHGEPIVFDPAKLHQACEDMKNAVFKDDGTIVRLGRTGWATVCGGCTSHISKSEVRCRILDILALPDQDRAGALVAWCRELEG